MSSDSDTLLKTMARPEVQAGLVLCGLERREVPGLCFRAIADGARLDTPRGKGAVAGAKLLRWLSNFFPAVWLKRAGWRANARHSAIAFASSLELVVQIDAERQRREKIIKELATKALSEFSPAFAALFDGETDLVKLLPIDLTSKSQIAVLSQAAKQAVVLCVASIDWAQDDVPPDLAVMNMEDAYSRAQLHYSLLTIPVPAAFMQDSSAHGAEGEGSR